MQQPMMRGDFFVTDQEDRDTDSGAGAAVDNLTFSNAVSSAKLRTQRRP
jgi:hypothetical protein